ncbi:MAG TPA: flagellar export chaperone FlgN [Phycisphaerales bacterium]|nr:flagellar export chaperone FlgN [Phycisphaerales bacterium]
MHSTLDNRSAANSLTSAGACERLREILADFLVMYERLESIVLAHREAIRRADTAAMQVAIDRHAATLREMSGLEMRRCELVAICVASFPVLAGRKAHAVTLTQLAEICPQADRAEIIAIANELKTRVARVRDVTQSLRSATATLLAHMEGLMRHVGRQLSHAGTYSSRGVVEPALVVSAVDLRS